MRPPATILNDGHGARTVLIHGAFGSPRFWTGPLPSSLSEGRVISYPLPAHGDWQLEQSSLERLLHPSRLADAYAEAIQQDFAGQSVRVVGHSTGAFIATILAARHPQLIDRIVLVGGFLDGSCAGAEHIVKDVILKSKFAQPILNGLLKVWTGTPTTFRIGMGNLIESWDHAHQCPNFNDICDRVRRDLKKCNPDSLLHVLRWLSRTKAWDQTARVETKALVVGGCLDRVVPFNHQKQIADHLDCPIAALDNVGHLPMVEHPAWFADVIDQWASAPR